MPSVNGKFWILFFALGTVLILPTQSKATNSQISPVNPVNIWAINVAQSGDWCVHTGEPVVLWRENDTVAHALKITNLDRSWMAETIWPVGFSKIHLSEEMPLNDGDMYVMEMKGHTSHITFHLMPDTVESPSEQAAWLLDHNCTAQFELLSDQ